MVIRDFNIVSIALHKPEADPPFVINGDRLLPLPISGELVESISWRDSKVIQSLRRVDVFQLPSGPPHHLRWKTLGTARKEHFPRIFVRERFDHPSTVPRHVTRVKCGAAISD
jgi:hypothetical protein